MPKIENGWELEVDVNANGKVSLSEVEFQLKAGANPDTLYWTGSSILAAAVERKNIALVELLLKYGADPNRQSLDNSKLTAVSACDDAEIAKLLLDFGGDPRLFSDDHLGANLFPYSTGAWKLPAQQISEQNFLKHATPRAGKSNPEAFLPAFWREQMRTNESGFSAAADIVGVDRAHECAPIWSFQRYGRSMTWLQDDRLIVVAGEHEDHYDADFYIYNDVTVFSPEGHVEHFIYPRSEFPPTDFHSATLCGARLILIGALGYPSDRNPDDTQVLQLNLDDFSVEKLETKGAKPGWIHSHSAEIDGSIIRISGGKRLAPDGSRFIKLQDSEEHILDLETLTWR